MKIFDCFMFYDESMLLDVRLNILNKFVDYFIIVESEFFHNGKKRQLKFDIKNYDKFKDKIIYIVQKDQPSGILSINENDNEGIKSSKLIKNAHLRENHQRNQIVQGLTDAQPDDLILISDVDEIPNLEIVNLKETKNKFIIFEQKIFYYKFNRILSGFIWYGTKACKMKFLKSPQWLRNIKNKSFPFWRIDTFFSDTKYIDKNFIKNGGWHFSNLKSPNDIELKLNSYLHHRDYEVEKLGIKKITEVITKNETIYDMYGDKRSKKFKDDKRKKLDKCDINILPKFVQNNIEKFKNWID